MQPIKNPIGRILIHLSLWVIVLSSTVPFIWTVLQSLKTKKQANARNPVFWFKPTLEHYSELWLDSVPDNFTALAFGLIAIILALILIRVFAKHLPVSRWVVDGFIVGAIVLILWAIPSLVKTAEFYDYFVNTIIVATGVVILSISLASLSAYALSRYIGLAGVGLLLLALAIRSLPRMAFALPYFWLGQISGLYDSYFLVIITLVAVNLPFTIYLLRSFFMDIPREIEESAMIDGASRLGAFVRVIVPIVWPGIIATALFTVVLVYHEFLLVRILTLTNWTLAVAMQQFLGGISDSGSLPLKSAAAVSAALPLVIIVLIFQKQLVKGLSAGAVKG
ncbi:MAG: carbohydrate ABC transporter permease [Anaerolineae bacterium]|nr:MAG: carbohydrate ABC transporter permease [Anaerolineae bacterium]